MGKPLSRPDCLRQNPRCLGKGDDEEAYIEDCYVPQRSIYDTMRINEQIDQGSKLSQPSRSTLGSGGGEGSTLSSNGTLGADIGGVFVARGGPADAGVKKLDERVIFDALKLTGDPQSMSPVGGVGSSVVIPASNSAAVGAAVVTKRRHQGSDKKDNPNRRSWKAFMPPTYPEFAERLELSPGESGEKRLSGAGIPVSPLHPVPSLLAASIFFLFFSFCPSFFLFHLFICLLSTQLTHLIVHSVVISFFHSFFVLFLTLFLLFFL